MDTRTQAHTTLQTYRDEIDVIDDQLVALLTKRSHIVQKVKTLKDAHWPSSCHIRAGREAAMHANMFARFAKTPIGAHAGAEFWRLFISASTMMESVLHIGTIPSTHCLAQNYFSPLAHYHLHDSISDLAQAFRTGSITIAALTFPKQAEDLHAMLSLLEAEKGLFIFAYAPLVLKEAPYPQALLIGNVTPEPSGNDVSYFSIPTADLQEEERPLSQTKSHSLLQIPGYHETLNLHPNARFLGTHGVPLTLSQ